MLRKNVWRQRGRGTREIQILTRVTFEQKPEASESELHDYLGVERSSPREHPVQRPQGGAWAWHVGRSAERPMCLQQIEWRQENGTNTALRSAKPGSPTSVFPGPRCFLLSLWPSLFVPDCLHICSYIAKRNVILSSESSALGTLR